MSNASVLGQILPRIRGISGGRHAIWREKHTSECFMTLRAVEERLKVWRALSISGGRLGWSGQCKDIHSIVFISCTLKVRGILEIG